MGLVLRTPDPREIIRTSLVVWGLQKLLERRERIMTSQGLGIRTLEGGLGPLCGLVVVG